MDLLASYNYSSWGTRTTASGTATSPFGFAGGYTDQTGLVYFVHRYYDPMLREFISVDPAVATTGTPYAYVGNNPANGADPSGLMCWQALEFGITSSSRQCWSSGYANAYHHPSRAVAVAAGVVAITAALASVVLTAGADTPAVAAMFAVSSELPAGVPLTAGAVEYITSGSVVLEGYAADLANVGLGAALIGAVQACVPPLGGAFGANCAYDLATVALGYGFGKISGLLGQLLALFTNVPYPFSSSSCTKP